MIALTSARYALLDPRVMYVTYTRSDASLHDESRADPPIDSWFGCGPRETARFDFDATSMTWKAGFGTTVSPGSAYGC